MKNTHLYPANWNDTIRPAILKRDNYKCQMCGVPHRSTGYFDKDKQFIMCDEFMKQWATEHGFKVQVLHLQIAHLDHQKHNCDESNLKAMCPRCHLNYDREYNMVIRKMPGRQQKKKF